MGGTCRISAWLGPDPSSTNLAVLARIRARDFARGLPLGAILGASEAQSMQRVPPVADLRAEMSAPRNLYPSTAVFATVQCVHQSYRMVPTAVVRQVIDFCFGLVSTRYRDAFGMEFYEYEFLSTHYHLVANNACGRITDFLQDLNSLVARELNAVRGTSGAFFNRQPGI